MKQLNYNKELPFFLVGLRTPFFVKDGRKIPLFEFTYLKISPDIYCRDEVDERKPMGDFEVYNKLFLCAKCGGDAEVEAILTPRALAAFNMYKNFYQDLKITIENEYMKVAGPCDRVGELFYEVIQDYLYYGL